MVDNVSICNWTILLINDINCFFLKESRLPFSFGLNVLKMHYEEITNGFRSDVEGRWRMSRLKSGVVLMLSNKLFYVVFPLFLLQGFYLHSNIWKTFKKRYK